MTIVYPDGAPTFWQFLCGKVPRVVVRAQRMPIPPEFCGGDYAGDPQYRKAFQHWLQGSGRRRTRRSTRCSSTPVSPGPR